MKNNFRVRLRASAILLALLSVNVYAFAWQGVTQQDQPLHPSSASELHQALVGTWYPIRYWGDANELGLLNLQANGVMISRKPIKVGGTTIFPEKESWSTLTSNTLRRTQAGAGSSFDSIVTKISTNRLQLEEGQSGRKLVVDYAKDTPDHLVRLVGRWKSKSTEGKTYADYWIRYDGTVLILFHSNGRVSNASIRRLVVEPGLMSIVSADNTDQPIKLGVSEIDGEIHIVNRKTGEDTLFRCADSSCENL